MNLAINGGILFLASCRITKRIAALVCGFSGNTCFRIAADHPEMPLAVFERFLIPFSRLSAEIKSGALSGHLRREGFNISKTGRASAGYV